MTCLLEDDLDMKTDGDWYRTDRSVQSDSDQYSFHPKHGVMGGAWLERSAQRKGARRGSARAHSLQELSDALQELNLYDEFFRLLSHRWKERTMFLSSEREILGEDSCRKILQLGSPMLPHIFVDLRDSTDPRWFGVLVLITGENPVNDSSRGKVEESVEAWLEWGRQHHYL